MTRKLQVFCFSVNVPLMSEAYTSDYQPKHDGWFKLNGTFSTKRSISCL